LDLGSVDGFSWENIWMIAFFYVMMMRNRSCRDGFREIAVK
jgi:hypothetical protein